MRSILLNLRPTIFGLIGFAILLKEQRAMKKRGAQSIPKPKHFLLRLVGGVLAFLLLMYAVSYMITGNKVTALVNACILSIIFVAYLWYVMRGTRL